MSEQSSACACGVRKLGSPMKPGDLQRDRIYPPHTPGLTSLASSLAGRPAQV
jgi:hypothetical protein